MPAIPSDRFAALEIALVEASRISLFEAKKLEKVDPQTAVARMREYKGYQQELTVLKSTRSTNGEPAAFRCSSFIQLKQKQISTLKYIFSYIIRMLCILIAGKMGSGAQGNSR